MRFENLLRPMVLGKFAIISFLTSIVGAVEQIRTVDLFLTKEVLCLLSYNSEKMATRMGLEPTTSSVTG